MNAAELLIIKVDEMRGEIAQLIGQVSYLQHEIQRIAVKIDPWDEPTPLCRPPTQSQTLKKAL